MLRVEHILDKSDAVTKLKECGYRRVVAIGDGANDAGMLKAATIGIAYGGVHSPASLAVQAADAIVYESRNLCNLLKML